MAAAALSPAHWQVLHRGDVLQLWQSRMSAHSAGGRAVAMQNTGRLAQSRAERMNAAKLQRCLRRIPTFSKPAIHCLWYHLNWQRASKLLRKQFSA